MDAHMYRCTDRRLCVFSGFITETEGVGDGSKTPWQRAPVNSDLCVSQDEVTLQCFLQPSWRTFNRKPSVFWGSVSHSKLENWKYVPQRGVYLQTCISANRLKLSFGSFQSKSDDIRVSLTHNLDLGQHIPPPGHRSDQQHKRYKVLCNSCIVKKHVALFFLWVAGSTLALWMFHYKLHQFYLTSGSFMPHALFYLSSTGYKIRQRCFLLRGWASF